MKYFPIPPLKSDRQPSLSGRGCHLHKARPVELGCEGLSCDSCVFDKSNPITAEELVNATPYQNRQSSFSNTDLQWMSAIKRVVRELQELP